MDFPRSSVSKESTCKAGHPSLIPGSGRSSGEGNGNPLWYSCLENSMDRGAWQATALGLQELGTAERLKHHHRHGIINSCIDFVQISQNFMLVSIICFYTERVTGRKARGLQIEEIACKCQTFLSLLSGRRKQTSNIFFLLYTNLKRGFS